MSELIQIMLGVAIGGFYLGKWLEASKWRAKAESGQLRESAGRLYQVTRYYRDS